MPLFNKDLPENVIAFTSDRTVDFSLNNEHPVLSRPQREFLFSQLHSDLPEPVHIRQVHGDRVVIANKSSSDRNVLEEADGLLTDDVDLPLAIRSADCLPVFLVDEDQTCIGLLHVGWKGAQKSIIEQAIELMNDQWNIKPENIKAAFGPSIHSCCYEVGKDLKELFVDHIRECNGKHYLDLPGVTRSRLLACGLKRTSIMDCDICTCCKSNYFSFRRENERAGRMISLMMIKK